MGSVSVEGDDSRRKSGGFGQITVETYFSTSVANNNIVAGGHMVDGGLGAPIGSRHSGADGNDDPNNGDDWRVNAMQGDQRRRVNCDNGGNIEGTNERQWIMSGAFDCRGRSDTTNRLPSTP